MEKFENSLNQLELAVQYQCGYPEEAPKFNGELSALEQLENSPNQLSRVMRNPGLRPGPIQTRQYSRRRWIEA